MSWTLSFKGDKAPPKRQLEELISWTTWPEAEFFSGRGVYTGEFAWNRPVPQRAWLNLTRVAEVAEISLSGHSAGVVWTPPAEVDLFSFFVRHLSCLISNMTFSVITVL